LVSALFSGGFGPWVPYQVFAVGWVGVAAGLVGRTRSVAVLAAVGLVMGYVFGAVMDVPDWVSAYRGNPTLGWSPGLAPPVALVHFARFYALTSFAYDSFRAVGNVVMVLALGAPTVAALERFRSRLTFEVVRS
ncbi:MAG TPA: ECF transporter S component, partial [Candidatus Dormibacteraeota bacterium]|nr:ECF transporter S component [Candidatus Dormibacteraeota bacterium]